MTNTCLFNDGTAEENEMEPVDSEDFGDTVYVGNIRRQGRGQCHPNADTDCCVKKQCGCCRCMYPADDNWDPGLTFDAECGGPATITCANVSINDDLEYEYSFGYADAEIPDLYKITSENRFSIPIDVGNTQAVEGDKVPLNMFISYSGPATNPIAVLDLVRPKGLAGGIDIGEGSSYDWEISYEQPDPNECKVDWKIVDTANNGEDVYNDTDPAYRVPGGVDNKFWPVFEIKAWWHFMSPPTSGGCMNCDLDEDAFTYDITFSAMSDDGQDTYINKTLKLKIIPPKTKMIGGWKTDPIWNPQNETELSSLNDVRDDFVVGDADNPYENTDKTFVVWNMGAGSGQANFSWSGVTWSPDEDLDSETVAAHNSNLPTWWRVVAPNSVSEMKMISTEEILVKIRTEAPSESSIPLLPGVYECNLITKDAGGVEFGSRIKVILWVPVAGASFDRSTVRLSGS